MPAEAARARARAAASWRDTRRSRRGSDQPCCACSSWCRSRTRACPPRGSTGRSSATGRCQTCEGACATRHRSCRHSTRPPRRRNRATAYSSRGRGRRVAAVAGRARPTVAAARGAGTGGAERSRSASIPCTRRTRHTCPPKAWDSSHLQHAQCSAVSGALSTGYTGIDAQRGSAAHKTACTRARPAWAAETERGAAARWSTRGNRRTRGGRTSHLQHAHCRSVVHRALNAAGSRALCALASHPRSWGTFRRMACTLPPPAAEARWSTHGKPRTW